MLVEVVLSSAGFGEVATLPFGHWVPRSLLSLTWTFAKFEVTGRHDQFARQLPLPFCTGFLRTIQQMFPSSRVVTVESSHCSDEAVPMSSQWHPCAVWCCAFRRSHRRSKYFFESRVGLWSVGSRIWVLDDSDIKAAWKCSEFSKDCTIVHFRLYLEDHPTGCHWFVSYSFYNCDML